MNSETAADMLRRVYGKKVSEQGARCAEFCERYYHGWHHFPDGDKGIRRTDWSRHFVEFTHHTDSDLCTFDFGGLTALMFLAHDMAIRVEVEPAMRRLRIRLFPRDAEGIASGWYGHPTIEEAVRRWREHNLPRPEPTKER